MSNSVHPHRFVTQVAGRDVIFEAGKLAGQADGAVVVSTGDTTLLATATASQHPREGIDFFPLTVDYEERLYAAGRIPGSFFRREGRPSEEAILLCRLTDRPLRPLFPKGFRNDVHIVLTALSSDGEHQMDILAINAASAALMISGIPPLRNIPTGTSLTRHLPTARRKALQTARVACSGSMDSTL